MFNKNTYTIIVKTESLGRLLHPWKILVIFCSKFIKKWRKVSVNIPNVYNSVSVMYILNLVHRQRFNFCPTQILQDSNSDSLSHTLPFLCLIYRLITLSKPKSFPNEESLKIKRLTKTTFHEPFEVIPTTPKTTTSTSTDFGFKHNSQQSKLFQHLQDLGTYIGKLQSQVEF